MCSGVGEKWLFWHWMYSQLSHSYYFTTCILVLKFVSEWVFEEIQDLHFPRKRWYFGTYLLEFGEKGVNFDVHCFIVKKGVGIILDWQVSVLSWKRGCFELKSRCLAAKKGSFSNWRTRMGTTFSSEWGSWAVMISEWCPWPYGIYY